MQNIKNCGDRYFFDSEPLVTIPEVSQGIFVLDLAYFNTSVVVVTAMIIITIVILFFIVILILNFELLLVPKVK